MLGLRRGDRVLLALRDTPAFYAAFLGAMRGGLVPVPVSTLLPPKDLSFIARDAGVRAALLDSALPAAAHDPSSYPADAALVRVDGWDVDGCDLGESSIATSTCRQPPRVSEASCS
jgi:benzoate-CoA ligase